MRYIMNYPLYFYNHPRLKRHNLCHISTYFNNLSHFFFLISEKVPTFHFGLFVFIFMDSKFAFHYFFYFLNVFGLWMHLQLFEFYWRNLMKLELIKSMEPIKWNVFHRRIHTCVQDNRKEEVNSVNSSSL